MLFIQYIERNIYTWTLRWQLGCCLDIGSNLKDNATKELKRNRKNSLKNYWMMFRVGKAFGLFNFLPFWFALHHDYRNHVFVFQTLKDGDMALFDMGAEYNFYGSDITCSFPVSNVTFYLFLFIRWSINSSSLMMRLLGSFGKINYLQCAIYVFYTTITVIYCKA